MEQSINRSVYVISDLHLGGTYGKTAEARGFRINTHVAELARFVDSLAARPAVPRIELVINGDMVDFLAEREDAPPHWNPFTADPEAACAKLRAIADRDRPFFDALGAFLDQGHRLTVLTGNHDVELALPPVRQQLREVIGVKPNHDYEFICNGEAYVVGDALIEHGNRYDNWNQVGYNSLREVCSQISRRMPLEKDHQFDPPPGSKMVSWVINEIKEDYKFIDLLKPETDVAVPLLLALEPGYRSILATVAKLALQARQHGMASAATPKIGDDISATGEAGPMDYGGDIGTWTPEEAVSVPRVNEDEAALQQILQERLGNGSAGFAPQATRPGDAIGDDISTASFVDRTLGLARLMFTHDDADIGKRLPSLLKALQALEPDRNFDLDYEAAAQYTNAARELLTRGFRFVIFGHTHLPKKIELSPGSWYINSGTWADLMQLPPEIITATEADARSRLEPFIQDLAGGSLRRWIVYRPTYVQLDLDADDHVIAAELRTYVPARAAAGA